MKSKSIVQLNQTSKFAVLDLQGISQPSEILNSKIPENSKEPSSSAAPAKKTTKNSGNNNSNTRAKGPTEHTLTSHLAPFEFTQNPEFLISRGNLFDRIRDLRNSELSKKDSTQSITVTLPDGKCVNGQAWVLTPYEVAKSISQGLADASCVAKVVFSDFVKDYNAVECGDTVGSDLFMGGGGNDDSNETNNDATKNTMLWDMTRPLVGNCSLQFLKFESDDGVDGRTVFWHSSAHILGEALESLFGANLTIGPPLSGGFYYDAYLGDKVYTEEMYANIEAEVQKIVKQKQKFERLVVTKAEALEMFASNPFKVQIISSKVPDHSRTTVYKCGSLIDLCQGPHVRHTGMIKAFACAKHSATNWLGDVTQPTLQRMYGISFPDKKLLKAYKENLELAKARDHRVIGKKQELFFFHDLSPGSAFFLPHGTRIYNKLIAFIKSHYHRKGYTEIITPNVFNLDLWHKSGHALHYKDAMFTFEVEGQEWGMKPMNCPGHCLLFASKTRSYKELPMRLADFGVLHRNELSGALTGLTRVRRFQQDDAHIYCTSDPSMIENEVLNALNFMKEVYDTFGMTYKLELSTRPTKALGDIALWDMAEQALAQAMDRFIGEGNWRVNAGDGAFYGPKIDIKVMDAMERIHQCATVQLDFQLPIRFDLSYKADNSEFERPVMIHRAMLGSVERMFAVLCEHYGGKWPLWLSPRQIMIIPVHKDWIPYCEEIQKMMHDKYFYVDVASGRETFQKKVRNAQIAQYNYQLVVGQAEVENRSVNVRTRDNEVQGEMGILEFVAKLEREVNEYK